MSIVAISGSPSASSRSAELLRHVLARFADDTPRTEIALRELPAVALVRADFADAAIRQAIAQVVEARLVLVATPIYKAAYSGLLKTFLDLLPQDALRGKTVLAIGTGGSSAHLLALDYALKPVLAALGARHILDTVYAVDAQLAARADGGYVVHGDVAARAGRALAEGPFPLREAPLALAA